MTPVQSKGGMWCENCLKPVVGKRRIPADAGATRGALFIGGGSLFGWGDQGWSCPTCGQGVRRMRRRERRRTNGLDGKGET